MNKVRAGAALLLLAGLLAGGVALAEPARPSAESVAKADEPVALDVVEGRVTDAEGRPVSGARVWLRQYIARQNRYRLTDADALGRFRFAGVEPGYHTVAAVAPGRSLASLSRSLLAGQPLTGLTLVLRAGQTLRLHVIGEDGKPVRGAELAALEFKSERGDWCWFPIGLLPQANLPVLPSDGEGRLVIAGVPEGCTVRAKLKHPDFARLVITAKAGGEPAEVRMLRGRALTIEALETATGKPALGTTVTISSTSHTVQVSDERTRKAGALYRVGPAPGPDLRDVRTHLGLGQHVRRPHPPLRAWP
jgi:hypothetical protein